MCTSIHLCLYDKKKVVLIVIHICNTCNRLKNVSFHLVLLEVHQSLEPVYSSKTFLSAVCWFVWLCLLVMYSWLSVCLSVTAVPVCVLRLGGIP